VDYLAHRTSIAVSAKNVFFRGAASVAKMASKTEEKAFQNYVIIKVPKGLPSAEF